MRQRYGSGFALIALGAGLAPLAAGAQGRPVNALGIPQAPITSSVPAERPGFGDNTALVATGRYEAEGGLRYADNQGDGSTYTVGSGALLRTGISPDVELRLGYDGFMFNSTRRNGSGNTSVGAKLRLHNATRYTPTVSVLPQVFLPTGDSDVVSHKVEPDVHFIWSKGLSDNISIGGNVNFAERTESDGDYHFQTALSVAGGYALSNRLGAYAEYYSIIPTGPDGTQDVIDGGFAYLTSLRTQIDAFIGTGLNDNTSNVYLGLGIAHLW